MPGEKTELGNRIAVTNAAGLTRMRTCPGPGFGKLTLDNLKGSAGGGNLYGTAKYGWHDRFSPPPLDEGARA